MELLNQFIDNYKKKYSFYETAGRMAAQQLEEALRTAGIRAIVTSRAKNPARLKTKVVQRNEKRQEPYRTVNEIYGDIADLSGVRVSLYFPGDREKVDRLINGLFTVHGLKRFPGQSKPPTYNKRFSGYWASHYRASMKEENLLPDQKKYTSVRIEIQVASLLMHAWSEVEHDLVYKPMQGTLSEEELSILDELNGLVLSGEIALERLQSAGNQRIKRKNASFESQYDMASYLYNFLTSKYKKDSIEQRMGYVELLFKLASRLKLTAVKDFEGILKATKIVNDKRTIAQQIIDQIINGNEKKYKLYLELMETDEMEDMREEAAAEYFVDQWIRLEGLLARLTYRNNPRARGGFNLNSLKRLGILDKGTADRLAVLRTTRNHLIHGIAVPDSKTLMNQGNEVREIWTRIREEEKTKEDIT